MDGEDWKKSRNLSFVNFFPLSSLVLRLVVLDAHVRALLMYSRDVAHVYVTHKSQE